jgi:hypothetical protein
MTPEVWDLLKAAQAAVFKPGADIKKIVADVAATGDEEAIMLLAQSLEWTSPLHQPGKKPEPEPEP